MKEPYIYVMPEGFMADQSVPAYWRLLGILNGFFINGQTVYASNSWLADKLQCSERTITNAVAELERLNLITCDKTRRSRIIRKKLQDIPEIETNCYLRQQPTAISDGNQLLSISDSNSDNKIAAEAAFFIEEETPPKPNKENKSRDYDELVEWLRDLTGAPLRDVGKQYKWLKLAKERGFSRDRLREHAEKLWDSSFYRASGIDWANVVQSLDKTTV